jgi:hypothetical protein
VRDVDRFTYTVHISTGVTPLHIAVL